MQVFQLLPLTVEKQGIFRQHIFAVLEPSTLWKFMSLSACTALDLICQYIFSIKGKIYSLSICCRHYSTHLQHGEGIEQDQQKKPLLRKVSAYHKNDKKWITCEIRAPQPLATN